VIDRAKFYDSDNVLRFTLGVGESGSGKDVIVDNADVNAGQTVTVTSITITIPAGSS
jgi:ribose 1,5-bisphosphokinase PhnN